VNEDIVEVAAWYADALGIPRRPTRVALAARVADIAKLPRPREADTVALLASLALAAQDLPAYGAAENSEVSAIVTGKCSEMTAYDPAAVAIDLGFAADMDEPTPDALAALEDKIWDIPQDLASLLQDKGLYQVL
jgi:hypothetical protein